MTPRAHLRSHILPALVLAASVSMGCGRSQMRPDPTRSGAATRDEGSAPATPPVTSPAKDSESKPRQASTWGARDATQHRVVFADRSSQGYLLLLPPQTEPGPPSVPSRATLQGWVDETFAENANLDEVRLLRTLIGTDAEAPSAIAPLSAQQVDPSDAAAMRRRVKVSDLIGLHTALLETDKVASTSVLQDPILSRALSEEDRASLSARRYAVLLRADYRAREAFRGLRLLQTLVRIASQKLNALILDPDTLEVRDVVSFSEARLRSATASVASQVTVVPFQEGDGETRSVRMTTRGMRRFGAVDLELTGLPLDPYVLQHATDLLYGIALVLVKTAEVDTKGFALQVEDVLTVHWRDIQQAYEGTPRELHRCDGCPENLELHLVERPRLSSDPQDHVVAQVVAPRTTSDPVSYDHPAWVQRALVRMFGG